MRSRLPSAERELLETTILCEIIPFAWIYQLPEPKDGAAVIEALAQLPAQERLPMLLNGMLESCGLRDPLFEVNKKGSWDEDDLQRLKIGYGDYLKHKRPKKGELEKLLDLWTDLKKSGEQLLQALRTYYEVFFLEEERRIRPALQKAVKQAQALADQLPILDLMEELSQGVRFDQEFEKPKLILVPSYWSTPLLIFGNVSEEEELILFGARPQEDSLVPGETVPDGLLRGLKALSDPTRLRILRYLFKEALTPTQLSRRLRLRPSTVVHHLNALRLATLVQLILSEGKEKHYAVRIESLQANFDALMEFLKEDEEADKPEA
jgi:DNA-binding transcriptional ArsR family regulator